MARNSNWQSAGEFFQQTLPEHLSAWMQHPRLTQSIEAKFDHQIQLLQQNFSQLEPEESQLLNARPGSRCWLREICHQGDSKRLVYARTVVPEITYERFSNEFNALGERSIGEMLLFKDPNIQRSELKYCLINAKHPLYARCVEILDKAPHYYARQSTFHWQEYPLLIIEVYSPDNTRWQPGRRT